MSLIFTQNSCKHPTAKKRYAENEQRRMYSNAAEQMFAANAMVSLPVPQEIFVEVDRITKSVITEPTTDAIFRDLMALSKPVDLGVLDYIGRTSSGTSGGVVSMSMSTAHESDITAYKNEHTIVPVFQHSTVRQPREVASFKHAGFDVLLDDHENITRNVRDLISDSFVNGAEVSYSGQKARGLLNSDKVKAYSTKVDFTSDKTSGEDMRNGLLAALQSHRQDSLVISPRTVYVSLEIDAQLDRKYIPTDAASRTIREELKSLPLVADIKPSALITGNTMVAGVLSSEFIRTIVGQEVSSFSNVRTSPFDPFKWFVWAAVGLNIRGDYNDRSGWCKITK